MTVIFIIFGIIFFELLIFGLLGVFITLMLDKIIKFIKK